MAQRNARRCGGCGERGATLGARLVRGGPQRAVETCLAPQTRGDHQLPLPPPNKTIWALHMYTGPHGVPSHPLLFVHSASRLWLSFLTKRRSAARLPLPYFPLPPHHWDVLAGQLRQREAAHHLARRHVGALVHDAKRDHHDACSQPQPARRATPGRRGQAERGREGRGWAAGSDNGGTRAEPGVRAWACWQAGRAAYCRQAHSLSPLPGLPHPPGQSVVCWRRGVLNAVCWAPALRMMMLLVQRHGSL